MLIARLRSLYTFWKPVILAVGLVLGAVTLVLLLIPTLVHPLVTLMFFVLTMAVALVVLSANTYTRVAAWIAEFNRT